MHTQRVVTDTKVLPEKIVDVERVLRQKSERLYHLLPGFVIRWLKRILHEEEVNRILFKFREKKDVDFIRSVLDEMHLGVKAEGFMDWEPGKRYIFVANHPLGGMDGLAFIRTVGEKLPDIVFPVNDLLMNLPNTKGIFIPVNKHGRNPQLVRMLDETFAGGKTLLYFPAGLCSRRQNGEIMDLDWKKTFVAKARLHQRDIVPVHITGSNSRFFYRLARIRKMLGIGFNIEMLFLVDEMNKQRGKTLIMRFGPPIAHTLLTPLHSDRHWAYLIRQYVYQIGRGDYTPFQP